MIYYIYFSFLYIIYIYRVLKYFDTISKIELIEKNNNSIKIITNNNNKKDIYKYIISLLICKF